MPNVVEVDQSGRIEEFGRDTVVAVSNGFTYTIRLTAAVKGELRGVLAERGVRKKLIPLRIFVATIILAILEYKDSLTFLMIDQEYTGYDNELRTLVVDRMRAIGTRFERDSVWVTAIGKKSPAHRAAIKVMRKQANPNRTAKFDDLLRYC
jgi:hypothetical protein